MAVFKKVCMIFSNKEAVTTFKSSLDENHVCFDEYSHYTVRTIGFEKPEYHWIHHKITVHPFFLIKNYLVQFYLIWHLRFPKT